MAAVGTAVPALGGLAAAAAVAGTTMGSVAVAASFGGTVTQSIFGQTSRSLFGLLTKLSNSLFIANLPLGSRRECKTSCTNELMVYH